MPVLLKEELIKEFGIAGTQPLTMERIEECIAKSHQVLVDKIDKLDSTINSASGNDESMVDGGDGVSGVVLESTLKFKCRNGKFYLLPEDHRIVQMNVKGAWDSYFFGSRADDVPAYRMVRRDEFVCGRRRKMTTNCHCCKKSRKFVLRYWKSHLKLSISKTVNDIVTMPVGESNAVFCSACDSLLKRIGLDHDSPQELNSHNGSHNVNRSYLTIYNIYLRNKMKGKKRRKRNEKEVLLKRGQFVMF